MNLEEALYTTRAMRRVKPDPLPDDVVHRIVDAAVRSPSGGNNQGYRFVTVSAQETKIELGRLYAEAWDLLRGVDPADDPSSQPQEPSADDRSTQWQVDHFADIPLWVLAFGADPCKSWSPLVASASASVCRKMAPRRSVAASSWASNRYPCTSRVTGIDECRGLT